MLVTGASGYLGGAVAARCAAVPAPRVDIRDLGALTALFAVVRPATVIHTATTLGNKGGSSEDLWPVVAAGAANVAVAARSVGARLVHVSSDAIFAGRDAPYTEADVPSPVFDYGAAKAAAEEAVAAVDPGAALVRTSLIVSGGRGELSRHERTCLDLAPGAALFTDEIRCPIAVDDLAAALVALAATDYAGVLNVAGPEALSRHELGVRVAARHGLDPAAVPASTLAASGLRRPGRVVLDSSAAVKLLGLTLRTV
ncbi:sugar nucleotide-binding protein [Dactylosporangium siamense]|uniref:NAD(P)-dependent oxidoreductase n=1 Tax=Dactylosporangium siamense TaxID=685454 RepID=A0A919PR88_9ACTN|nr:sugar nucleotide-binding protein [Dactylosporangium siamense]GIG48257.1 NAD(P)-dependent oxidoreductase [Dactylosporangium siamense]